MAKKLVCTPLPGDLPEDWKQGQIIAPAGADVGLTEQHGYNYQSAQINSAHRRINALVQALDGDIDCGLFEENEVVVHNVTTFTHENLILDGNMEAEGLQSVELTLEEHIVNPNAHQNMWVDGNDN